MTKLIFITRTVLWTVFIIGVEYAYCKIESRIHMSGQLTPLHALLITPKQEASPFLFELLSICNIVHNGTIESIITATQKHQPEGFLRTPDKERWEIAPFYENKKDAILAVGKKMGMFDEIKPARATYTYAVIHGGAIGGVRKRIAYLLKLWQEGIRWNQIVILTGQRPLNLQLESLPILTDSANGLLSFKEGWTLAKLPTTEVDMINIILEQSKLPFAWGSIPINIIDTPMKKKNEKSERPTTKDTICQWLQQKPDPGSILAISNQPYIGYQDAVMRKTIPNSFTLETVGPEAQNITPEILVDTIARWLYNTQ